MNPGSTSNVLPDEQVKDEVLVDVFIPLTTSLRIGPARVKGKVFDIHDAWDGIIHASTFCIYDKELRDAILKFYFVWNKIIQKGIPYYSPSRTPGDFVFGQAEFDMFDSPEQEQRFNEIMQKWYGTALQFRDMMECIKHKYIIDWEDVVIK